VNATCVRATDTAVIRAGRARGWLQYKPEMRQQKAASKAPALWITLDIPRANSAILVPLRLVDLSPPERSGRTAAAAAAPPKWIDWQGMKQMRLNQEPVATVTIAVWQAPLVAIVPLSGWCARNCTVTAHLESMPQHAHCALAQVLEAHMQELFSVAQQAVSRRSLALLSEVHFLPADHGHKRLCAIYHSYRSSFHATGTLAS
jgi:hypothetical protein